MFYMYSSFSPQQFVKQVLFLLLFSCESEAQKCAVTLVRIIDYMAEPRFEPNSVG